MLKSGDDVLDLTKDAVKLLEVQRSGHWAYHAAAQALLAVAEKQVQIALLESHVTHRFSWNAALRRVAAHPTEPYFATADDTGKIVLWRGALRPEQAPKYVTSTLHWHAHAVDALCFTHSGSHLLSGKEGGGWEKKEMSGEKEDGVGWRLDI